MAIFTGNVAEIPTGLFTEMLPTSLEEEASCSSATNDQPAEPPATPPSGSSESSGSAHQATTPRSTPRQRKLFVYITRKLPLTWHIYLASFDKGLEGQLKDFWVVKVLKYVDDYLVLITTADTDLQNRASENVQTFLQTTGVYIGSKVAPVLSTIFLSRVDRELCRDLNGVVSKVFRFVDDYLVLGSKFDIVAFRERVLDAFVLRGNGLKFTTEVPVDNKLKFLDVLLKFEPGHVCWVYSPRTGKPLLSFSSDHSRLVRNGLVVACFRSTLFKSCFHSVNEAFGLQVSRLREAGYPLHVLQASCERLLRKLKHVQEVRPEECAQRSKVTVIPYVHGLSHRLKKVAENYDVKVVFSAKNKIGSVCSRVKQKYEGKDT